MVKNQEKSLFFVQRFFFFFQKKVHTKNFTIIWAFPWFFTFIQQFWFIPVYSCQIWFIPDYSCLYLSIPVLLRYIFFSKTKTTIRPGNSIAKVKLLAGLLAKPGKKIEGTFFDRRNRRHYDRNVQISSENYNVFMYFDTDLK